MSDFLIVFTIICFTVFEMTVADIRISELTRCVKKLEDYISEREKKE